MELRFRPEARRELREAQAWYEERVPGLGFEFARAVDAAAASILRFPKSFPHVHGDLQKAILRRFPYTLIFFMSDEEIVVLACFHHRRDPERWQDRV